ncbi:MAG: prepilin-type N-terminal cleavage/methylation domain-containing protein [Cyanobacteria bacterium J06638_7]
MNRSGRSLLLPRRPPPSRAGFTLIELLVGLLISALFVPLIWTSIRGAIQFFEATIWQVQLERDLDRLTTVLDSDAQDACLFGTAAAPGACAAAAPTCVAGPNNLRMRVTLVNANNVPTGANAVVTYVRNANNELLRSGPTILASGRLDPANTAANNQLVMRGVTLFQVTPNTDCNTATIAISVQPVAPNVFTAAQTFGTAVDRTIGLRTGSRSFVD